MEFAVLALWWVLYVGLGLLALPAASVVFAPLSDRGAGLAIPFAFAVIGIAAYWIGQVRFGLVAAIGALGVLLVFSGGSLRRGVDLDIRRYRDAVVVFTVAYLLLITIRGFKPGVWPGGGEKFLDFGLLASLLRSTALPPQDMWFAGEPVQYYYGGHMLAAVFALLTETPARYAYNTAIGGYYAAYVTAAWGLAGAIAHGIGRSYRIGGGLAAFFVAIASNLSTPFRVLIWALPDSLGTGLAGLLNLEARGLVTGPTNFDYWIASRVIEGAQWPLINEFPFFAFLNGDLHAHMMSPGFLLLVAGLAYSYWRTPEVSQLRRYLLLFVAIPLVSGLLLVVNTWSFPAAVGITWLTVLFAPSPPWRLLPESLANPVDQHAGEDWRSREFDRLVVATGVAVLVAALSALAVLPFVLGPASGRAIGLLPEPRSDLPGLLLVHGIFLAISAGYLAIRARESRWLKVGAGFMVLLAITWLVRAPAVGLFAPLLVGGWYLVRTREGVDFETVLLVGVMGLVLLVEFAFVVEEAGPGRSNTVFKIYTQVWALWSVAAGAMASCFVGPGRTGSPVSSQNAAERPRDTREEAEGPQRVGEISESPSGTQELGTASNSRGTTANRLGPSQIVPVLLIIAVVALSIYAAFGVGWAVTSGTDSPTLDAHSFIEEQHPEEAAAIEWLSQREGQPTMVSAPGVEIYQWVNAPSSMTGIPTVAGWVHEIGYRGEEDYRRRVHDVEILFDTDDPESRADLLEKYDVEYIYVGPIERERYDIQSYDAEPGITVEYQDDHVTIYRVESAA